MEPDAILRIADGGIALVVVVLAYRLVTNHLGELTREVRALKDAVVDFIAFARGYLEGRGS